MTDTSKIPLSRLAEEVYTKQQADAKFISDKTYVHEQGIASDTWEIQHNLNKYPSVTLVDSANTQFEAQVVYNDKNNCTVYMNGATKGKAYLN